jgi:SHAQKYF class myb-like DNA-binding protein
VYKIKDTKTKQHINIKLNTTKKSNIFTNINSSPIKSEEKPTSSSNSFSINTNNSSDSGKGITNFLQNEKTFANTPQKNEFLSKKTKFHIDFVDNEKKCQNNTKKNGSKKQKKTKKNKIIFTSSEDDVNEGRWNINEHNKFIEAISIYGNDWKEVQQYVGTRSSNQVRSHAQKFFLKLKAFKDPSLDIDFTTNNIKNLSDIINKVKEYEKENNYSNLLFVISQKISERNFKNTIIFNENNENVLIKDSKIIINNESLFDNININTHQKFFILNENINNLNNSNDNKNEKKIVKFCKLVKNKNNNSEVAQLKSQNENRINEEKNENKETKGDNRINENTMKKEDYYFDNVNDKNNNYIIHDFDYDNLNDFKYEINNPFCSFTGFLKESNTLSIMNKNYFC